MRRRERQTDGRAIRIAGLAGNDTIGLYTLSALDSGAITTSGFPLNLFHWMQVSFASGSRDYLGVFDGKQRQRQLLGSTGRDQLDGGAGSDTLFGFAGDDRLWGD